MSRSQAVEKHCFDSRTALSSTIHDHGRTRVRQIARTPTQLQSFTGTTSDPRFPSLVDIPGGPAPEPAGAALKPPALRARRANGDARC